MRNAVGRALYSEVLKLKRTLALRLILLAPVIVALLAVFIQTAAVISGRGDLAATLWQAHTQESLTMWAVFLMPLLIAVETALLSSIEHGERQWKHLFALPVPRFAIYAAKFVVAQALILLSTLLLTALIATSGWLLVLYHPVLASAGPPPLWSIAVRAVQCWLAGGLILSINLWIALRWPSFTVPLGVGIAGTFVALFASSAKIAKYFPWLLPFNVLSADRLSAALMLGVGGGLAVAVLGAIDFSRREELASPQLRRLAILVLAGITAGFVGLALYLDRDFLTRGHTSHAVRFITVEKGVRLEVLDWGGSGRAVVLLAGLGDTAHVFDALAPKLTGSYHVYGITRRGFGASSHPISGYSADRLGDDVLQVADSLKLVRPVLAGHSIGGEELSSIGSRHPEKVAGLVYLDAAYPYAYYDPALGDFNLDVFELEDKLDRLKPGSGLRDPGPVMEDLLASLPGFERIVKEKLQQFETFRAAGSAGPQTATASTRPAKPGFHAAVAITAGERKYTAIHVPILAIYALPHDMGPSNPRGAAAEAADVNSITGPQARAFEKGVPSARVVRLPRASHYVFQSNESDVLREMKAFISALPR
jgi:pimeloyl-ACP methyl ester carboxylesterase